MPGTLGNDFLNGCRALLLDTELWTCMAGLGCGARRNAQSSFPGPFLCLCPELNHLSSSTGERETEAVREGSIFVT